MLHQFLIFEHMSRRILYGLAIICTVGCSASKETTNPQTMTQTNTPAAETQPVREKTMAPDNDRAQQPVKAVPQIEKIRYDR